MRSQIHRSFSVELPIPVAARPRVYVCGRLVAGVAVSNPARGMDVCLLCLYVVLSCVGIGLCGWLITRPEESHLRGGGEGPIWAVEPYDGWMVLN
jgi:hypothetical protein